MAILATSGLLVFIEFVVNVQQVDNESNEIEFGLHISVGFLI